MSNQPVGYFFNGPEYRPFLHGIAYDYIVAENGVFIEADGNFIKARISIAEGLIRGLNPLSSDVLLKHGKIPQALFDLALNTILTNRHKETYLAITWKDGYHLFLTPQEGSGAGVRYDCMDGTIVDIHSHPGEIGTRFSGVDNRDEQGFRLSLLVAYISDLPAVAIRLGVYGYYYDLHWSDVFDGNLTGATDMLVEMEAMAEHELQSEFPMAEYTTANRAGRHWWDWLIGRRRPV